MYGFVKGVIRPVRVNSMKQKQHVKCTLQETIAHGRTWIVFEILSCLLHERAKLIIGELLAHLLNKSDSRQSRTFEITRLRRSFNGPFKCCLGFFDLFKAREHSSVC